MENELIFGIDLSKETLDTQKFLDKSRTRLATDTEVERKLIAGYVADTLHLTDSLLLSGGLRLEITNLLSIISSERTFKAGFRTTF